MTTLTPSEWLTPLLNELASISLPDIGLMPFSESDILNYFNNPGQFGLPLNKKKGAGILYGVDHCRLRRAVVNAGSTELRTHRLIQKLVTNGLMGVLSDYNGAPIGVSDIVDIQDIGMAHAVWRVTLAGGAQLVIKQESHPNQPYYQALLKELGFPFIRVLHYSASSTVSSGFEISDWVDGVTIGDHLFGGDSPHLPEGIDRLIETLAWHAALGDMIGREDRHLENYIWDTQQHHIIPVDTAALFGVGNESWVYEYVAGGLAECAILAPYLGDEEAFRTHLQAYFDAYQQAYYAIGDHMEVVIGMTTAYMGAGPSHPIQFLTDRIQSDAYCQAQLHRIKAGVIEWHHRWGARCQLESALANGLSLTPFPLLSMYHLAHRGRGSAFFLKDFHRIELAQEWDQAGLGPTHWIMSPIHHSLKWDGHP